MIRVVLLCGVLAMLGCAGGASSPCDPASCTGCCTPTGVCVTGDTKVACGTSGVCQSCTAAESCSAGQCVLAMSAGGGSGGGGAASAGGGTGGGGGGAVGNDDAGVDGGSTGDDAGVDAGTLDAGAPDASAPTWILETGLTAAELGVLVNVNDPQSVLIADAYVSARHIPSRNVVRLAFDAGDVLSSAVFAPLKVQADAIALDAGLQAWAITWTTPYRVDCMSIGTAFAVAFDAGFCSSPCRPTTTLPSFDDEGEPDGGRSAHRPFDNFGIRPTMMLATGADAGTALELIARGVAADDTDPRGEGWFFRTTDSARSVRWPEFLFSTLPQWSADGGLALNYVDATDGGTASLSGAQNVLFYFQGLASVPNLATNTYRPGAVADHLTSYGGQVPTSGQMSILRWIEAGATGSYGTVVEPCNYTTKFSNTTVLLSHYYRGEPLIEAYWKSVAMPGEGLFIGEPLATPWRPHSTWDFATRTLTLSTTQLEPGLSYAIDSAPAATGPWTRVRSAVVSSRHERTTLTVQPALAPFYRLVLE